MFHSIEVAYVYLEGTCRTDFGYGEDLYNRNSASKTKTHAHADTKMHLIALHVCKRGIQYIKVPVLAAPHWREHNHRDINAYVGPSVSIHFPYTCI